MPELVPAWERLTAMIPGDPEAAAALALWNPPPFLTGCSQAAVLAGGPALIRNYDWDYRLLDGAVGRTEYAGRRVLGMLDCLWGLLDGVNDAGLAVSLTFGGRPEVGAGFGIPLVIRYVLETCGTVAEAVQVLRRVPVHMSYNVTAVDRGGRRATVYVAPDRPARITDRAATTNHQGTVEWAPYAAAIGSVERLERLEALLAEGTDVAGIVAACLRSPLYASRFREGFGTLYTAEYRPIDGVARYHWPHRTWEHSLDKVPCRAASSSGSASPQLRVSLTTSWSPCRPAHRCSAGSLVGGGDRREPQSRISGSMNPQVRWKGRRIHTAAENHPPAQSRSLHWDCSCCRLNPRPQLSGRLGQTWDYPARGPRWRSAPGRRLISRPGEWPGSPRGVQVRVRGRRRQSGG